LTPEGGLRLVHGSTNPDLTIDDITVEPRAGTKQGKGKTQFGGFYASSEERLSDAEGYAGMGSKTGAVFNVDLSPDAVVVPYAGDITRISKDTMEEQRAAGADVLVGKDVRGRTEYVVINKGAIQNFARRDAQPEAAPEPMTVQSYVDRYIAGEGRDSLEMQQFAANFAPEIEAEFQKRLNKPAPTQAEQDVSDEAEVDTPQAAPANMAFKARKGVEYLTVEDERVPQEVRDLQALVDSVAGRVEGQGYTVRFAPNAANRAISLWHPKDTKITQAMRFSSVDAFKRRVLNKGIKEITAEDKYVDGKLVTKYTMGKDKTKSGGRKTEGSKTSATGETDRAASQLNQAQKEQVALLLGEIDTARKARDINDAERTELVNMLRTSWGTADIQTDIDKVIAEAQELADEAATISVGRLEPILKAKTKKLAARKLVDTLLGSTEVAEDLYTEAVDLIAQKAAQVKPTDRKTFFDPVRIVSDVTGVESLNLTFPERAARKKIRDNATKSKELVAELLAQKRAIYDRVRMRMADMKGSRAKKLDALRADFKAGRMPEQRYRALMGQLRPDMVM
jgi:hypothetical protein